GVQRFSLTAKVVYKTKPDPHNVPARPFREGQRLVPFLKHRMTETMQTHTPRRPALRFAVLVAAAALLSLTAALTRSALAARAGGDAEEERVKKLQQQQIEQQKAMKAMKGKAGGKVQYATPIASFPSIRTDPEGFAFTGKSAALDERVGGDVV